MRIQTIRVAVPDDFEDPDKLVQSAMERYLFYQDRWRLVHVLGISEVTEIPGATPDAS